MVQDLLYKPVALECGHTFCSRCAVAVAVGHSRGLGDAHWLIRNVAAYCDAGCPTCRSTVHGTVLKPCLQMLLYHSLVLVVYTLCCRPLSYRLAQLLLYQARCPLSSCSIYGLLF